MVSAFVALGCGDEPGPRPAPSAPRPTRTYVELADLAPFAEVSRRGCVRLEAGSGSLRSQIVTPGDATYAAPGPVVAVECRSGLRVLVPGDLPVSSVRVGASSELGVSIEAVVDGSSFGSARVSGGESAEVSLARSGAPPPGPARQILLRCLGSTPDASAALAWLELGDGRRCAEGLQVSGEGSARAIRLEGGVTADFFLDAPAGSTFQIDTPATAPAVRLSITTDRSGEIFHATVSGARSFPWPAADGEPARVRLQTTEPVPIERARIVMPGSEGVPRPPAPARVVWIVVDTLRADVLQTFRPGAPAPSPAMAALAERGTLFANAMSPANWTKPSVASLLTGLDPLVHGVVPPDAAVPGDVRLLSEILQQRGVRAACFSANHFVSRHYGFGRGWDVHLSPPGQEMQLAAPQVFGPALEWLRAHRDERTFLYVQTMEPHAPYDPPHDALRAIPGALDYQGWIRPAETAEVLQRTPGLVDLTPDDVAYMRALYAAEVLGHERQLDRFIRELSEDPGGPILLVVVGDHGEELGEQGRFGHGRGVESSLLHVPLIVVGPGVTGGRRVEAPTPTHALAATTLEALGFEAPSEMVSSLWPELAGVRRWPEIAMSGSGRSLRITSRTASYRVEGAETVLTAGAEGAPTRPGASPISSAYFGRLLRFALASGGSSRAWERPDVGTPRASQATTTATEALREELRALGYVQ